MKITKQYQKEMTNDKGTSLLKHFSKTYIYTLFFFYISLTLKEQYCPKCKIKHVQLTHKMIHLILNVPNKIVILFNSESADIVQIE